MSSTADSRAGADFDVDVRDQGLTRTITPQGDVDLGSVDALRDPLFFGLTHGFDTVVLDFARTTFLDSTGIKLVLDAVKAAAQNGAQLILLPGPPAVQRAFDLCGLSDTIRFTGHEALAPPAA